MKSGMTRWKTVPEYSGSLFFSPNRVDHSFVPVARPTKFSTVLGAVSSNSFTLMSPMLVTSVAYLAMPISFLSGFPSGGGECLPDRIVAHLPEVLIPLSDCHKRFRRRQAHYLIDFGGELQHRLAGGNGHRDDQAGRLLCPQRAGGCGDRGARGDAVVHQDHEAARDRRRRAVAPERGGAAENLLPGRA